jgi:FKBP-type peptidyl-prolyl cis-trans isomerase FkpA
MRPGGQSPPEEHRLARVPFSQILRPAGENRQATGYNRTASQVLGAKPDSQKGKQMHKTLLTSALVLAMTAGSALAAKPLKTEEDKTLYALGLSVGQSLKTFSLTPAELERVKEGMSDAVTGAKPKVEIQDYMSKLNELAKARQTAASGLEKKKGEEYAAKAAKEKGAVKTESGLVFKELTAGKGESPKATDQVKVHYRGTLIDGTEFDSSYKRNEPATFPLNGVIPCWTEGVQKMQPGGKAKLVCPSSIAYGDRGRPSIPGGATLVFEVELLEIVK